MILKYKCYAEDSAVIKVDDRMLITFKSAGKFSIRGINYYWDATSRPTTRDIISGLEKSIYFVGVTVAYAERRGNNVELVLMTCVEPYMRELTPPQAAQVLKAVEAAINFVVSNWGTGTTWQRVELCK